MARLAFVGVGLMGQGMAANLLAAGHDLTVVVHRNRAPVEALLGNGAHEAADLAALARDAEVIFFCLSNSEVVEQVVEGLRPHLRAGQTIVDTSTADPVSTVALAAALTERGIDLVDAPVTGGPPQAAAGQLATLVGAAPEAFERTRPLLECYSKSVTYFGPPGAGHQAKLLNNFVTQGTVVLIARAYGLARALDIDWAALYRIMSGGAARSGTLEKMVAPALEGDFRGQAFSLENAAKDLRYFARLAEKAGRPEPLAGMAQEVLSAALQAGFGERYVSELLDPVVDAAIEAQTAGKQP